MPAPRLYLTGASGTGTTTLGRALGARLGLPHVDTDDHFWLSSDPPFTHRRAPHERGASLAAALGAGGWIVTGACEGWGDAAISKVNGIVFLSLNRAQRLVRLRRREAARFGPRILPGGDMVELHRGFLDWAMSYDDADAPGRSRHRQEAWLERQRAPVLRLDAVGAVNDMVQKVIEGLQIT